MKELKSSGLLIINKSGYVGTDKDDITDNGNDLEPLYPAGQVINQPVKGEGDEDEISEDEEDAPYFVSQF